MARRASASGCIAYSVHRSRLAWSPRRWPSSAANFVLLAYRGTSTIDPVAALVGAAESPATVTHRTPVAPPASWAVLLAPAV